MGMYCDQIKGYQMQVLDEYLELWKTSSHDDTVWERYISGQQPMTKVTGLWRKS